MNGSDGPGSKVPGIQLCGNRFQNLRAQEAAADSFSSWQDQEAFFFDWVGIIAAVNQQVDSVQIKKVGGDQPLARDDLVHVPDRFQDLFAFFKL